MTRPGWHGWLGRLRRPAASHPYTSTIPEPASGGEEPLIPPESESGSIRGLCLPPASSTTLPKQTEPGCKPSAAMDGQLHPPMHGGPEQMAETKETPQIPRDTGVQSRQAPLRLSPLLLRPHLNHAGTIKFTSFCADRTPLRISTANDSRKNARLFGSGKSEGMGRTILTRQQEFPLRSGRWLALKPRLFLFILIHDSN